MTGESDYERMARLIMNSGKPKEALTSNQCGVKGCKNTSDSGTFVGPFCAPCDHDLRTGKFEFGTSVVYEQAREIERLKQQSERRRRLLVESRSYIQSFASLTKHPTAPADAKSLVERIKSETISGDSSAPETPKEPTGVSLKEFARRCEIIGRAAAQLDAGFPDRARKTLGEGLPEETTENPGAGAPGGVGVVDLAARSPSFTIPFVNLPSIKIGDKCGHCGNEWLLSPDGKGLWHNCHTGLPSKATRYSRQTSFHNSGPGDRCDHCSRPISEHSDGMYYCPEKASEDRRPTGQCSWGCYYNAEEKLVRDPACTVHGAS